MRCRERSPFTESTLILAALVGLLSGAGAIAQDAKPAPAPAQPAAAPAPPAQPGMAAPQVVGPDVKREPPPLNAEPGTIALGFMDPETSASGKTKLTNTGDKEMKLLRAQTSCSCTVATDITDKVLKPGESIDLEATLKGGKYPGQQQKKVMVFVDGYAVPIQIWVTGEVAYGVKSTPTWVDCFQTRKGLITFESTDGKPFRILSVNCEPAAYEDFDPAKDEPKAKYTLKYDYQSFEDPKLPRWFLVETDHPKAPVIDLRVINPALIPQQDPQAPWNLMEDRGLVGALKVGESKEVHIGLRPIQPPSPDAAKPVLTVDNPAIGVEFLGLENGAEGWMMKIKVTALKGLGGCTLLNEKVKISWLGKDNSYDLFGRVTDTAKTAANAKNGPIMQ